MGSIIVCDGGRKMSLARLLLSDGSNGDLWHLWMNLTLHFDFTISHRLDVRPLLHFLFSCDQNGCNNGTNHKDSADDNDNYDPSAKTTVIISLS